MKQLFNVFKEPFKVISTDKSDFLIWFLFTIVSGQFGVIANIIVRYYSNNIPLSKSILLDSITGSFYTFSIALVASMLGPIFIDIIKVKDLKYRTVKILTITASIFFLFISGTIYASIQAKEQVLSSNIKIQIDFTQLITYLTAIFLVSYGYCVIKLQTSGLEFPLINDPLFSDSTDLNVNKTLTQIPKLTKDSNGVQI